ncbi:UvrD-helicase domain-containing protein [Aquibacillus sediminis]|uniref:UvrD-helicase domain-containing protein n=1 Tax=Aquibacillus sediminis TaxID=2574734 RepID=UPI001108E3DB|nr:UvrD-helicase domain-containing protein [Aquibacillus sediminis]
MINFKIDDVLFYTESSSKIEHILSKTYRRRVFPYFKRGLKNRHLPLLNKTLYEQIIKLKRIPTVEEFELRYLEKYSDRTENTEPILLLANNAYKSLLTDLHFYFILKESKLFDDVAIEYIHDTAAKTDILLKKNGRIMGLQLFSGSKNYEESKKASIKKLQVNLGYELFLFSLQSKYGERKSIKVLNGEILELYSLTDAELLSEKILGIHQFDQDQLLCEKEEVDTFELLDEPITSKSTSNTINNQKHSVIFGGYDDQNKINDFRKKGIKVFDIKKKVKGVTPFTIQNGVGYKRVYDYLKKYGHTCKGFNIDQFAVEHADQNENIAINAGAGSGKTTTLVSRILYLLDTGAVRSLDEIAMITFTNEAANNMETALTKKFMEQYHLTGNQRYHHYLQDLQKMKIMTIPSFGKQILNDFGHYIGLGENIKVSTLKMERDQIIDQCLDEIISGLDNPFENLEYYKATKFILDLWDKLEQKGVTREKLADYIAVNDDILLKSVITKTIIRAEEKFNELKVDQDKLTVSDLTRYLKKLSDYNVPLEKLQNQYKYLFVDEFQDTDISQIEFIATVAVRAKLKLVVVGDIKQSIYRFRGANSTAFTVLNYYLKKLGYSRTKEFGLFENFRSSKELVEEVELYLSKWRKHYLLPSDDMAMYSRQRNTTQVNKVLNRVQDSITRAEILKRFGQLPSANQTTLAILVRTNDEARQIGELLKGVKNVEVQMDGTLFMSKAARDILILLNSWIFPRRKEALFSLSTTSFVFPQDNFKFKKYEPINKSMRISGEDYKLDIPTFWKEAHKLLKYKPLLTVLNEFILHSNYRENLKNRDYTETEIRKYKLNLQKILMQIHSQFNDRPVDLLTLYDWLKTQVMSNRDIDEAELGESYFDGNLIKVLTVHKAKGLEFHTVLIPYTNSKFVKKDEYIKKDTIVQIEENGQLDFEWKYIDDASGFISETQNYSKIKQNEDNEQRSEETRLLYVAMTRAEKLLYIYDLKKAKSNTTKPNTWGDLLLM